jgi:hypothetical protein
MFDLYGWLMGVGNQNRSQAAIDRTNRFLDIFRMAMMDEYRQAKAGDPTLNEERKILDIIEEKEDRLSDLRLQMRDIQDEIKGQKKRVEEIRHNRVTGQIEMTLDTPDE